MGKAIVERLMIMNTKVLYLLAIFSIFIYSAALWYFYIMIFQQEPKAGGFAGATSGFEGFKTFFSAMLIGPLFETFVFQFLIIRGMLQIRYFKTRIYIPIMVSALCFSLSHDYSVYYIAYAFGSGLVLAVFYAVLMWRKEFPFLNTLLLHSILNFIVFLSKIYY